jgi:hypothetical protein
MTFVAHSRKATAIVRTPVRGPLRGAAAIPHGIDAAAITAFGLFIAVLLSSEGRVAVFLPSPSLTFPTCTTRAIPAVPTTRLAAAAVKEWALARLTFKI